MVDGTKGLIDPLMRLTIGRPISGTRQVGSHRERITPQVVAQLEYQPE